MPSITCLTCENVTETTLKDGPPTVSACPACPSEPTSLRRYAVKMTFEHAGEVIATLPAEFSAPSLAHGITYGALADALGPAIERFAEVAGIAEAEA